VRCTAITIKYSFHCYCNSSSLQLPRGTKFARAACPSGADGSSYSETALWALLQCW
jgi:hypothetical protein